MDELDPERSKLNQTPPGEDLWNNYGTSISLGFVATAVFLSMFIIMAIFEHLFRPNQHPNHKIMDPQSPVQAEHASDLSVLMPGQQYPTYIAHPTPLPACSREGVYWPSHHQHVHL